MVRYADDFVILCKYQKDAEEALEIVQQWTQSNGLELHPDKTHMGNCREKGKGFEFLGYRFERGHRLVRNKSLKSLREKIKEQTKRTCGKSIEKVISKLNRMLKGWFEYFKHAVFNIFKAIDSFIRRRLRAILREQTNRPGFGKNLRDHKLWPNQFFAERELFTMSKAHILARQSR